MIKLSDRLQKIADRIEPSKTMADIGTDHGFLPVYLLQRGICERAVAADISAPSLEKAVQCGNEGLPAGCGDGAFQTRVGNGLSVLEFGEVEAVVIAGMGGRLICDIMEADLQHTCSFSRFVLQPRSGQGILRKWLVENGFRIIGEDVVKEGRFLPEIITALSPDARQGSDAPALTEQAGQELAVRMQKCDGEDICWKVPPWMTAAEGRVLDFLQRNLQREERVLQQVRMARKSDLVLEQRLCNNIAYLTDLKKEYQEHGTK